MALRVDDHGEELVETLCEIRTFHLSEFGYNAFCGDHFGFTALNISPQGVSYVGRE